MFIRKNSKRFIVTFLFFIVCLGVFTVKLVLIQIFKANHLGSLAQRQHNHVVELEPVRGSILDRNLRPLGFNVSVRGRRGDRRQTGGRAPAYD